jgi:hypothetical protein
MAAPGVELRAQIDAETVKALLYMHGGASIALLAFLPSVFEKPVLQPLSTAVLWALFVYQVGLVCTVIHNRLRRKCSLEYEAAGYKPKPCDRTWLKWLCLRLAGDLTVSEGGRRRRQSGRAHAATW